MPVKGDEIVGYVTKGQGISVHKKGCNNIPDDSERTIEVSWNDASDNYYYTNIYVYIKNNNNTLAEIITEIGKKDSLVRACREISKDNSLIYELNIRIKNKDELEKIMNALLKINNVVEVSKYL